MARLPVRLGHTVGLTGAVRLACTVRPTGAVRLGYAVRLAAAGPLDRREMCIQIVLKRRRNRGSCRRIGVCEPRPPLPEIDRPTEIGRAVRGVRGPALGWGPAMQAMRPNRWRQL
jgi:hypothetical protein